MKTFIVGLLVGVAMVPLVVFLYFWSGHAPVATSAPPMLFEKKLARMALHARMDKEIPEHPPVAADEPNLLAGAQIYRMNCAVCHGLPGDKARSPIEKGMFPKPPALMHGTGVTDDPPGESYWKVANGIRLTGMPGFTQSLSETEMWQVSLLVANADKLPPPVQAALSPPLGH